MRDRVGSDNVDHFHKLGLLGPRATLAHAVWLTAHEQRLIAETQTSVVHCPSSNLKLASGIAKVPELAELGVRWGLGCDGAPCNNNLDVWMEMRLAALLPKPRLGPTAMPAKNVLEMATLGGARALGLEREIGSIEVGKRADLVALDLSGPHGQPADADIASRLVYAARAADVRHVLVDGRVVVRGGRLLTADVSEIRDKANAAARRLVRTALG